MMKFYHVPQYQPNPVTVSSRQQTNPYTTENHVPDGCDGPQRTLLRIIPSPQFDLDGGSD